MYNEQDKSKTKKVNKTVIGFKAVLAQNLGFVVQNTTLTQTRSSNWEGIGQPIS